MTETAKTADHALALLLLVSRDGPRTPSSLATELGLNRTVVHRLLGTLHERGFVMRTAGGYVPGPAIIRVATRVQDELRAAARTGMARLADDLGETVVLHIADGDQALVLEQAVSTRHVVRVEHAPGSRSPLALGASGRALLAFLSADAIERVSVQHPDSVWLRHELAGVRQLGHAISHDELQGGACGLAVPVLDREGRPVAALAVLCPTSRAATLLGHLAAVEATAGAITAAMPV